MKKLVTLALLAFTFILATGFVIYSTGISNKTGSPAEGTCADCHSGGPGITSINISASPVFIADKYIPGHTYTINVTVTNSAALTFGFDAEILNSSNANAGNISIALSGVQITNGTRKNATHTAAKAGSGAATFQFVWVAPSSGLATIYASGNAFGTTGFGKPINTNLGLSADISAGVYEAVESGVSGLTIYPNPVKSNFKISYNLIEAGMVKAEIVNLQGKAIVEIVNENQINGTQVVPVQLPDDLAKGIYFVKLSVNSKAVKQKMIITQ